MHEEMLERGSQEDRIDGLSVLMNGLILKGKSQLTYSGLRMLKAMSLGSRHEVQHELNTQLSSPAPCTLFMIVECKIDHRDCIL